MVWNQLERDLPSVIKNVSVVRVYNKITNAGLTHFEYENLGVVERDEVLTVVDNADLFA